MSVNIAEWARKPGEMMAWFERQLKEFYVLPRRIGAARQRAQRLRAALARKGDVANVARVDHIVAQLSRIQVDHGKVQAKVAALWDKLGALGLELPGLGVVPAIPVAVVITAGAVAVAVAAILADMAKQERLLDQVAKGSLTAEEAKALGAGRPLFGLDVGKMVPLGLVAVLLLLGPRLGR